MSKRPITCDEPTATITQCKECGNWQLHYDDGIVNVYAHGFRSEGETTRYVLNVLQTGSEYFWREEELFAQSGGMQ